jgi:hypothetical protein
MDRRAAANVAEQRFGDAESLIATGDDERANGAHYLLGFAIEILLKGRLLDHPAYQDRGDKRYHAVRSAVWGHHDLKRMCDLLDQEQALFDILSARGRRDGNDYVRLLQEIAGEWTVFARYAVARSNILSAREMRDRVAILKEILK